MKTLLEPTLERPPLEGPPDDERWFDQPPEPGGTARPVPSPRRWRLLLLAIALAAPALSLVRRRSAEASPPAEELAPVSSVDPQLGPLPRAAALRRHAGKVAVAAARHRTHAGTYDLVDPYPEEP